jgi:WD40 repeat protein
MLAVGGPDGTIRLLDAANRREWARLPDPNQAGTSWITFSPDGAQLIATSNEARAVHVWDLRQTRRELTALGLDWQAPTYPPARSATPLRLVIIAAEQP